MFLFFFFRKVRANFSKKVRVNAALFFGISGFWAGGSLGLYMRASFFCRNAR